MFPTIWSALQFRRLCLASLTILVLALCSGCNPSPAVTYSIKEQYDLARTRMPDRQDYLKFSFQLEHDQTPVGQDIFFTATFTNTLDQSIVFREPRQQGVMDAVYPDTVMLYAMEPVTANIELELPLRNHPSRLFYPDVTQGEFITLAPHISHEIRLQLPHILGPAIGAPGDWYPLPPGIYRVQMTYMNDAIGYEVEQNGETRYVDLNAWVGEVEAPNLILLTITPEK
jgi:hypothetical protein